MGLQGHSDVPEEGAEGGAQGSLSEEEEEEEDWEEEGEGEDAWEQEEEEGDWDVEEEEEEEDWGEEEERGWGEGEGGSGGSRAGEPDGPVRLPRDIPTTDVDYLASVQAAEAEERRQQKAEAKQQRALAVARAESGEGLLEGLPGSVVGKGGAARPVLSKRERLLLRRQALHMDSSAVFSVGKSQVTSQNRAAPRLSMLPRKARLCLPSSPRMLSTLLWTLGAAKRSSKARAKPGCFRSCVVLCFPFLRRRGTGRVLGLAEI